MTKLIRLIVTKKYTDLFYNKKYFDSEREAVEKIISHLQRLLVSGDFGESISKKTIINKNMEEKKL